VSSEPDDRREVALSLLPSDAVFLSDYATGSLRGPALDRYVGSAWTAGVFDPRDTDASQYRARGERPSDLSYTVPVAERVGEVKAGTPVAVLVDEVTRLRAALARLRPRVSITQADVDEAGMTWDHVDAWVLAQPDGVSSTLCVDGRPLDSWRLKREAVDGPVWQFGTWTMLHRGLTRVTVVRTLAAMFDRTELDMLDELCREGCKR
jgi:hypothetical protein